MLTAMARKNLGLYFCGSRSGGCHFTGKKRLAFTGNIAPERLRLFFGVYLGTAACNVMAALLTQWLPINPVLIHPIIHDQRPTVHIQTQHSIPKMMAQIGYSCSRHVQFLAFCPYTRPGLVYPAPPNV